ncbi:hydrogenase [Candidatus Gastranaerophilales bacterium]|nr:MAG: hydrogenase [Candidatus Gastranaerophilales bacterium]
MMINLILIFPILACLIMFIFKAKWMNNFMINVYALMHLVVSIACAMNLPCISSKYFCADSSNIVFLLLLSIVFMAVAIYNNGYIKHETTDVRRLRHYSYMILIFVLSMTGAILSTNLGLSWVFIEATTLASAYLIYFSKTKTSIEAAWKYVYICSIGIALAFVGIILLTISTGNMNSLTYHELMANAHTFNPFWLKLAFVFILFGIGTKMGLAPVHFWLPDAHSESPSPVSALLSAALLNSAFLIILNVYKITVMAGCADFGKLMMLVMGFLSLFITAVFVFHINNYKRMLAYSSVENMGILIIGCAVGGLAMYAAILHMIGHSLIKASFFLTSGNILEIYKTKKIKSVTGILKTDKKTGWLWIASFLGIVAFPPSVLFISEFLMIKSMILQKHYVLCGLFVILLTIVLYGLGKAVIKMSFGSKNPEKNYEENVKEVSFGMYFPQFVLLVAAFALGIYIPQFVNVLINGTITGLVG